MRVVCPTMHAEQLHLEPVWSATRAAVEKSQLRWTIFVDPLYARIEGADIAPVLAWFAENGHEVAMHTHHHLLTGPPGRTTGYVKGRTLTDRDVHRCLRESFEYLRERGHTPQGFVSGSWLVLDSIFAWLSDNAFRYDSTLRTYANAGPYATIVPDASCPGSRRLGSLLEVPTTATLRRQLDAELLRRRCGVEVGDITYDLYYLHDFDFLQYRARAAVSAIARRQRNAERLTVGELVDRIGSVVGN